MGSWDEKKEMNGEDEKRWEDVSVWLMKRKLWMEMMKIDKKIGRCMGSSDGKMEMNEDDENRWGDCLELEMIRYVGSWNASEKLLILMVG